MPYLNYQLGKLIVSGFNQISVDKNSYAMVVLLKKTKCTLEEDQVYT